MSSSKVLILVCLLSLVLDSNSKVVYRKYERKNQKKNYVEVIEVFETIQKPPKYLETEKDLNDFLGKDSFKSSINCTEIERPNNSIPQEVPAVIVTTRRPTTWTTSTTTTVTQRPMKPTIKPNPFENTNPDYTSLYRLPRPDIQVTKHLPNTSKTIITIKETDDHPATNRNTLSNEDNYDTEYTDDTTINNNGSPDYESYDDDDHQNENKETSDYNDEKDDVNNEYFDSRSKRNFKSKSLKLKHTTKQ
ncbi:unnamed protein product [Diamesa serratosioi]